MPSLSKLALAMPFACTAARAYIRSVPLTAVVGGYEIPSLHRRDLPLAETREEKFFWFGNYSVGGSAEALELLIDTGSSDIFINPGRYSPGPASIDMKKNFTATFVTANSDGTGYTSIEGSYLKDSVMLYESNLTVPSQDIGVIHTTVSGSGVPRDGLIGFAGPDSSFSGKLGWFENLCAGNTFPECRFGLAFSTDRTGVQYLGGVEQRVFSGDLVTTPLETEWVTWGDVAVNGEIVQRDTRMLTDMGTAVIWGPIDTVQKMYEGAGIEWETFPPTAGLNGTVIQGYYPCASPPTFGFAFPSTQNITDAVRDAESPVSRKGAIFNVVPEALVASESNGICNTIVKGVTDMDIWIVGQPFYQGRYVDHSFETNTMGWADLK